MSKEYVFNTLCIGLVGVLSFGFLGGSMSQALSGDATGSSAEPVSSGGQAAGWSAPIRAAADYARHPSRAIADTKHALNVVDFNVRLGLDATRSLVRHQGNRALSAGRGALRTGRNAFDSVRTRTAAGWAEAKRVPFRARRIRSAAEAEDVAKVADLSGLNADEANALLDLRGRDLEIETYLADARSTRYDGSQVTRYDVARRDLQATLAASPNAPWDELPNVGAPFHALEGVLKSNDGALSSVGSFVVGRDELVANASPLARYAVRNELYGTPFKFRENSHIASNATRRARNAKALDNVNEEFRALRDGVLRDRPDLSPNFVPEFRHTPATDTLAKASTDAYRLAQDAITRTGSKTAQNIADYNPANLERFLRENPRALASVLRQVEADTGTQTRRALINGRIETLYPEQTARLLVLLAD